MKFENTEVFNFEGAIHGMRNPMNSWSKSDSYWGIIVDPISPYANRDTYIIGEKDLELAQRLINAGSEHRKFLRQIMVSVDITAPLYWWKEFDTYKVGTTANSTSTMHKLATTPITMDCFETGTYQHRFAPKVCLEEGTDLTYGCCEKLLIEGLEDIRKQYLETKDKRYWYELIRWLPESWLQTRTVTMNYENLYSMYRQRKDHKLNEWSGKDDTNKPNFINWVKSLPYAKELIIGEC